MFKVGSEDPTSHVQRDDATSFNETTPICEETRTMADDTQLTVQIHDLSRRDFVALSVAGIAAATATASGEGLPVTETEVTIQTPDGTCDAAFIHPATGAHPAVIIWPDAFGLRASMRDMARR